MVYLSAAALVNRVSAANVRLWRQATFDSAGLKQLGLQTAHNSPLLAKQDKMTEQTLMQLLSFVFLLMEGQIWDTAWRHEAFPNRFATPLRRCVTTCCLLGALAKLLGPFP